jgi:hypothetical protein
MDKKRRCRTGLVWGGLLLMLAIYSVFSSAPAKAAQQKCDCSELGRIAQQKQSAADQAQRALAAAESEWNRLDQQARLEQDHANKLLQDARYYDKQAADAFAKAAVAKTQQSKAEWTNIGNEDVAQRNSVGQTAQQAEERARLRSAEANVFRAKVAQEKQDAEAKAQAAAAAVAEYQKCLASCPQENRGGSTRGNNIAAVLTRTVTDKKPPDSGKNPPVGTGQGEGPGPIPDGAKAPTDENAGKTHGNSASGATPNDPGTVTPPGPKTHRYEDGTEETILLLPDGGIQLLIYPPKNGVSGRYSLKRWWLEKPIGWRETNSKGVMATGPRESQRAALILDAMTWDDGEAVPKRFGPDRGPLATPKNDTDKKPKQKSNRRDLR